MALQNDAGSYIDGYVTKQTDATPYIVFKATSGFAKPLRPAGKIYVGFATTIWNTSRYLTIDNEQ